MKKKCKYCDRFFWSESALVEHLENTTRGCKEKWEKDAEKLAADVNREVLGPKPAGGYFNSAGRITTPWRDLKK